VIMMAYLQDEIISLDHIKLRHVCMHTHYHELMQWTADLVSQHCNFMNFFILFYFNHSSKGDITTRLV
jgi:hypothetical protein